MKNYYEEFTNYLVEKEIIKTEKKVIYQLGFDVIGTFFIQTVIIILAGWILGSVWNSVWYLVCFCSIREYAGGYHASTRTKCTLYMLGIFLIVEIAAALLVIAPLWIQKIIFSILTLMAWLIIGSLAPAKTNSKKLDQQKLKHSKWLAIMLMLAWILAAGILQAGDLWIRTVLIEAAVAVLIIVSKKGERKHVKRNERESVRSTV